jgi:hypothetical protein
MCKYSCIYDCNLVFYKYELKILSLLLLYSLKNTLKAVYLSFFSWFLKGKIMICNL